ncbi:MAG TPA: histidine kinase N-terminal 7TM domain-containing protein, partial [Anaerolineales bacterium]|nr:histidine kinase N-terminal 7TM domain-containing protein [Anaerolineales bacterium]
MQWQTNPYFAPIIISSLIAIVCAFFVITRRNRASGSTALLGLIFSVIIWGFAYAMELASVSLKWQIFWAKVEYLGIPFVPLFFFIFAYQFTQSTSKLSRRVIFFLVVISSIFVLLAWTNEFHNLIWTELGQKNIDGYYMLTLGHGMAFWLLIT